MHQSWDSSMKTNSITSTATSERPNREKELLLDFSTIPSIFKTSKAKPNIYDVVLEFQPLNGKAFHHQPVSGDYTSAGPSASEIKLGSIKCSKTSEIGSENQKTHELGLYQQMNVWMSNFISCFFDTTSEAYPRDYTQAPISSTQNSPEVNNMAQLESFFFHFVSLDSHVSTGTKSSGGSKSTASNSIPESSSAASTPEDVGDGAIDTPLVTQPIAMEGKALITPVSPQCGHLLDSFPLARSKTSELSPSISPIRSSGLNRGNRSPSHAVSESPADISWIPTEDKENNDPIRRGNAFFRPKTLHSSASPTLTLNSTNKPFEPYTPKNPLSRNGSSQEPSEAPFSPTSLVRLPFFRERPLRQFAHLNSPSSPFHRSGEDMSPSSPLFKSKCIHSPGMFKELPTEEFVDGTFDSPYTVGRKTTGPNAEILLTLSEHLIQIQDTQLQMQPLYGLPTSTMDLDIRQELTSESSLCRICLSNAVDTAFFPCRHSCSCIGCARELVDLADLRCPVCRKVFGVVVHFR